MALACVNGVKECGGCLWCQGESAWPGEEAIAGSTNEKPPWSKHDLFSLRETDSEKGTQALQLTLKRLDTIRDDIARATHSLGLMEEEGMRATTRLSHMRYERGIRASRVEHAVITKFDLEREIYVLNIEKEELLGCVSPYVERLPAGTGRAIVKFRFVDGMSCREIGLRLHYSRSYIYKALAVGIKMMARDHALGIA